MRYPKEIILNDGTEAVIRPLEADDRDSLTKFYLDIPENDRWYMKVDVTEPEVIQKWIQGIDNGKVFSILAVAKELTAAHASLHLRGFGATRHVGRLRIMVLPEYRHKRLGTWMLLDLIQLAMDKGLRDIRSDFVVGVEDAAIEAAFKLDFFKKAILEDYVKGPDGKRYDLMIMSKRLHKDWSDF